MTSPADSNTIAVFDRHQDVELALRELQRGKLDMKKISILGRDAHTNEHAVGFFTSGDRVKYWGKHGAFWGAVFGILVAPAAFFIPGIGPILTGGIIGSLLMGAVEGGAVGAVVGGGASAFVAALTNLGIPDADVLRYEAELKADKFLVIATGAPAETERARQILAEYKGRATVHVAR